METGTLSGSWRLPHGRMKSRKYGENQYQPTEPVEVVEQLNGAHVAKVAVGQHSSKDRAELPKEVEGVQADYRQILIKTQIVAQIQHKNCYNRGKWNVKETFYSLLSEKP